jgi:hypothetical protein
MPQNTAVCKIAKVYNPRNRQQVSVTNIKHIKRVLITWDQPRARYELAGFGSMRASFRNHIHFQRFSRRVGFFCKKTQTFLSQN